LSDIQRQTHLEFLQTTSGEWRSTIRKWDSFFTVS
jgi:hypothetical protein